MARLIEKRRSEGVEAFPKKEKTLLGENGSRTRLWLVVKSDVERV